MIQILDKYLRFDLIYCNKVYYQVYLRFHFRKFVSNILQVKLKFRNWISSYIQILLQLKLNHLKTMILLLQLHNLNTKALLSRRLNLSDIHKYCHLKFDSQHSLNTRDYYIWNKLNRKFNNFHLINCHNNDPNTHNLVDLFYLLCMMYNWDYQLRKFNTFDRTTNT